MDTILKPTIKSALPSLRALLLILGAALVLSGITHTHELRADPRCATPLSTNENRDATAAILRWHNLALKASSVDHTPGNTPDAKGPAWTSRAYAIVHLAIFDTVNAFSPKYYSYLSTPRVPRDSSIAAAIAQAAHDALVFCYPSQKLFLDRKLKRDLRRITDAGKDDGIEIGKKVAKGIIEARTSDGSEYSLNPGPYTPVTGPGLWVPDALHPGQTPYGEYWYKTLPFAIESASQFRLPPPPALDTVAYADAYKEVKRLGGDGFTTATERTAEQTIIGTYWGYDGASSVGVPPTLYNQITTTIAEDYGTTRNALELARLLALVNLAMADACISAWESKYVYYLWRPVTGIREQAALCAEVECGTDPNYTPLGAPASNGGGMGFTPPFPAYPSGHAAFGGATFQTLRRYYGTDLLPFSFVSDELNGVTTDGYGNVRPLVVRSFNSLSEAEEENGQSRIYIGIHWEFDKTAGIAQGRLVGNYVYGHAAKKKKCSNGH